MYLLKTFHSLVFPISFGFLPAFPYFFNYYYYYLSIFTKRNLRFYKNKSSNRLYEFYIVVCNVEFHSNKIYNRPICMYVCVYIKIVLTKIYVQVHISLLVVLNLKQFKK